MALCILAIPASVLGQQGRLCKAVNAYAPCHSDDERLGGYGGLWTFFRGESGEAEQLDNEFRAYRCFAIAGGVFSFYVSAIDVTRSVGQAI